ncbi:MAG: hypothetical protein D6815_04605, partial [Candidatus Dadabacteria bacterium]
MKVLATDHSIPRARLENASVIGELLQRNRWSVGHERTLELAGRVQTFLERAGTRTRYRVSGEERALDLLLDTTRRAMARAGVGREDVDFVIYTGVSRGWIEP